MGAHASTAASADGADAAMDDAWAERAWVDGVPFTLLHDDAFVAEKFQELQRARGADAAQDDADDALDMTGTDELPMDELERMADAARIKLFASGRAKRKRDGHDDQDDAPKKLSAVTAMQGTALERPSRAWVAIERRRAKQCEIVRDYYAQLTARVEKRARDARERARQEKALMSEVTGNESTTVPARLGDVNCASLPSTALFQVASFRMQLEMLKAFRTTNAELFESGILSLVKTVLEFPPFVLHSAQGGENKEASVETVLVSDVYRFCRDMLQLGDLKTAHRDALLVMLLSLGICSGRSALLIEFVAEWGRRLGNADQDASMVSAVGNRSLGDWIDELLARLESYRVHYELGDLTNETLVKLVSIKTIKDDSTTDKVEDELKQPPSVATDGSYVYTWSLRDGMSKIGTGLNFTVAGRVYARAPARQYLQSLQQPRMFRCGFYGSGLDATRLLQEFASNPTRQFFEEAILVALRTEDQGVRGTAGFRLFLQLERDGDRISRIFDDHGDLCSTFTETDFLERARVLFAFYGEFVVLHGDALCMLKEAASVEDAKEGSSGVLLDAALIEDLVTMSSSGHVDVSTEKELVLLYSISSKPKHLFLEKFTVGDSVSSFERQDDKVYFSSIVCCGGQLYLSLLCPVTPDGPLHPDGDVHHEPRTLLQISPVDLSMNGSVSVSGGETDIVSGLSRELRVSRPIFAYVTEGQRLYEVELTAERLRVRVFVGLNNKTAKKPAYVRSFDVDIKQIQCATYVNCFLKMLKRELRVGDLDFILPTFMTNGSYMWMVLPSLSPPRTSQASDSTTRLDCFVFDCEYGQYASEDSNLSHWSTASVGNKRQVKSFERTVPSASCCYDATNNTIWILNMTRGTLSAFKNSGRRIPQSDVDNDDIPSTIMDRPGDGNARTRRALLRVLSFLAKHSADSTHDAQSMMHAYSVYKDVISLEQLLDISERCLLKIGSEEMTAADEECLRCSLIIMRRSFSGSMGALGSPASTSFQARLSKLLTNVIHGVHPVEAVASSVDKPALGLHNRELDVRVVSAALALSAQIAHLDDDLMSQMDRVVSLIQKWRKQDLSPSDYVVLTSLLRQLRKTIEMIGETGDLSLSDTVAGFENLWGEIVEAQERMACDDPSDLVEANTDVHQELIALVNLYLQCTFHRAFTSVEAFRHSLTVFRLVCQGTETASARIARRIREGKKFSSRIEKKIQIGIVRQVAPICLASAAMIVRSWAETSQGVGHSSLDREGGMVKHSFDLKQVQVELGSWLKAQSSILHDLYRSLRDLSDAMEADLQTKTISTVSRTTRAEVMESSHEYANSLDVTQELRIPGATQITITFDSRTRTEFSYDYITFYKDKAQTTFYGEQYYSGRDAEFNWPGVGGLPPLLIDSDHCYVYFHTDASNTDWGYKFTAVGELFEKASIVQRHWLTSLTEMAAGVIDEVARLLVQCTHLVPVSETEARNDKILHSELIRHGVAAEREQDAGVIRLLRDFAFPPDGSDAARVLNAMERGGGGTRLRSLSKSVFGATAGVTCASPVNTAIRAAVAAILHHNMWGMDAYAFTQNLRSDVSEQLLRAWKNAQKMRDWFHLGDAADAVRSGLESPSSRSSRSLLRRQPSAYKGMSDDALEVLSKNVVDRASFLLEMTPMSFSYVSGAKRRWGFIAKYGSAIGVVKNPLSRSSSNSTLGSWYSLLDELQEATELRSLLHYRRSSSERRKSRRIKSVTEQVLEFIQSDIDIGELRELIRIRNLRAEYRACGLWLYRNVSAASQSLHLKMALAESCSLSLRKIAKDAATALASLAASTVGAESCLSSGRLHFGTFLCGCDGVTRRDVNNAFGACLNHYVQEIGDQDSFDTDYVVALIKAMCIDYDADDTYLLQESSILPQLLRLLASKASRIRRSGQVLLDIFLSRLADAGDTNDDPDSNSVDHFQKQLFATVGLQLEGISSQLRDLREKTCTSTNPLRDREHNLGGPLSALTVPVSDACDARWNHSIMLWVYVSSALSSYSLKVGDEVQLGPSSTHNDEEQDSDDNSDQKGVVTAITSPTSVRVKWPGKSEEEEHQFDPRNGKLEVVLADEGLGGVVFSKGTKNLVKDGPLAAPWSHFGLYMNDRRQLSYRISCGPDKECVYDTNYELSSNEWAHIAIIQVEEVLKFYINGLVVSQHILDPFLLLRSDFSASESRMIESVHPIAAPADQYWPVHIPGASRIRVTFDPLSEIDQSCGFVRFYKNARCCEVWGEDKYTGRYHDPERNFPGALSNRHRGRRSLVSAMASQGALEIPCDRFLVYFHHGSDSTSWGFRILVTPSFSSAVADDTQQPRLNAHPLLIGEPPARALDVQAARCWVYQPEIVSIPLEEDEIIEAMHASCPTAAPVELPLGRTLHVIGLLHTCSETARGRELIATPENVGDLIVLAFEEIVPVEVRRASAVVLKELCSSLSAQFISDQFTRVQPIAAESYGFVSFVFHALSNAVNVWSRCNEHERGSPGEKYEGESQLPCPMELQIGSTEALALVTAYASLFRHLAHNSEWLETVCGSVKEALSSWIALQSVDVLACSRWKCIAADISAALVVLGGGYNDVSIGGRVKCCASIDSKEAIETGCLLRFQQKRGVRTARILFDCEPANPVNVPTTDVAYFDDEDCREIATFVETVAPVLLTGTVQRLYGDMLRELNADLPQENASFKPKLSRKENVEVLESEHPYASGEDITYPLFVHGVQEIVIFFDEMSCTAGPNDYVSFLKRSDDNRSPSHQEANNGKHYWGEERYFGESFPGVGGTPPLRIPASSVDVYFHTDSSSMGSGVPSTEWGFKLTAHAYEETLSRPPENPPTFHLNAINDIRARALKSLHTCLRLLKPSPLYQSVFSAMSPVVSSIVRLANASDDGRPTQWPSKTQSFESKHPYSNSVRECMTVTFSCAARLIIAFDPQSKTEQGSDYVTFFKDQSLSDRWGEQQYSGSDESANWPGVGDRMPLAIPSDSFTLLWVTDASNVEWGWRFTVTVEYPIVSPMALRLDQLNKQAGDLWEIFNEGIGPQRRPFGEEYDGFERFASVEEWNESRLQSDPKRFLLLGTSLNGKYLVQRSKDRKFRVVDDAGVDVIETPSPSGVVLTHVDAGNALQVVAESKEWLKAVCKPSGVDEVTVCGWVKRRTHDKFHVVPIDMLLKNEDVIVIGVDDCPTNLIKPSDNLHIDDSNTERHALTLFVSQFSIDALKGQSTRYQSLAYDTHRALMIKYAREALCLLIITADKFDRQITLNPNDFGSPSDFLLLLSRIFEDKDGELDEVALENGLRNILLSSNEDDGATALINRCLDVLTAGIHLLPSGRGAMRVLESRHPYPDDAEQYWQVSIPGAKRITVYFDPQSKTEESCDWVCFYKNGTDRAEFYGESLYHGRNGNENWPGCGGRPPLVIDADNFEVYFHSDANQNDWGFKLFAIGVFDEGDEASSGLPPLDDVKMDSLVSLMKLSLWLLVVAAKACLTAPDGGRSPLASLLFSPRVVEVLASGIENHPRAVRALGLKLLQQLAQNVEFMHSLPSTMVEKLYAQLISKIRAQFLVEDRSETKSEYLQMLVECALFVDLAADSAGYVDGGQAAKSQGRTALVFSERSVQKEGKLFEWSMVPKSAQVGRLHLQFFLGSICGQVDFRLISERISPEHGKNVESKTLFHWQSSGNLMGTLLYSPLDNASSSVPLQSGDVMSVFLDLQRHSFVVRKNNACVCSTVQFDPDKILDGENMFLRVVVTTTNEDDLIEVKSLSTAPLAALAMAIAPNWYHRLSDAASLLFDFEERRVSSIVECESAHPLQDDSVQIEARQQVCIDGAEALEIRFDRRTVLDDRHRIRFYAGQAESEFEMQVIGIRGSNCDEKYPALFMNDPIKRTGILKPDDRVTRSSDWCYADEDGGPGSIGVVEAIIAWEGRSGCGVRVRWTVRDKAVEEEPCVGVYRYGYEGFFDVQLLRQPKEWDEPLIIPGNTVEYVVDVLQDEKDGEVPSEEELVFQGTVRIDPSPSSVLNLDVRKTKLVLGDECSVEFWVLVQGQPSADPLPTTTVLPMLEIVTLDPSHGLSIGMKADGRVCILTRTDEGIEETSTETESVPSFVLEDQWIHVAIVFASSKVSVYVNGDRGSEVPLDRRLVDRNLYISALQFGGSKVPESTSVTLLPLSYHIFDVRIWDVALRSEQVHGHASGIDGVGLVDSADWQNPKAPPTPKKQSQLLPPPSPRSPGSPARATSVPPYQRKWITANRTGRDLVTIRAGCPIPTGFEGDGKPVMIYYEAHILSGGKVCVGFVDVNAKPSSRHALVGEFKNAVGLELPRKHLHFDGTETLELEEAEVPPSGLRSPRRRTSSAGGTMFADIFSREGDVVGCAFVPSTKDFMFFLNGVLVAQVQLESQSMMTASTDSENAFPSPRRVQRDFDSLVDEMLSLGFSRQASEDALDATAGTMNRAVPRAVDWLLEEGTAVSSPRRLSSSSPFSSPRRRLSSSGTSSRRATFATGDLERAFFAPAATLGAQGAQGIAWNFGQHTFKYTPVFDGVVVAAMTAGGRDRVEGDANIYFDIFDHSEEKWERVVHRHRVQDMEPTLLGRWKLDEGAGMTVYDSSGRDQVGTIQTTQPLHSNTSGPSSPRPRKLSCWDANCLPPVSVTRNNESPLFTPFPGTDAPEVVLSSGIQKSVWGYRFYVIPHYSASSIGRRRFQTQAHKYIMEGPPVELRHDHQLAKYVNKVAVTKQLSLSQILRASWAEIAPNENELVKWPVLVEVATGVTPSASEDDMAVSISLAASAKAKALDRLGKRFKLLQELNGAVSRLLPFVAFSETPASGAGVRLDKLVCGQRYRIFHAVKRGLWDEALKRTTEKGEKCDFIANRPRAMRHRVTGKVDTECREALFSQAFRQLSILGGHQFRRTKAIYKVEFLGENAQDAGGPYRETLAQFADELHSSQLPLLIATSNAQHNVGAAREKWALNPSATSTTYLDMLEFLGKLMGAAMRSQEYLPLHLALLVWKKLTGERVTPDDLALVDSMIVSSMDKIRTIDKYGVTAEMFEDIVMETFTTLSTDNRVVPLKPHGASIAVTFDSRVEFADLVESYRLHEFDVQIAALVRGLAKVVPPRLLSLFTGAELEHLVCGSPEVDIDLLQRCTEYSSCSADDSHIVWFWQVLHEFSHEERSAFLRFVWGRSRLPPSEKDFPQRFKLQSFNKTIQGGNADAYLPIAHTCFFSVELPRYSSVDVVREKLTYAMYNCQEIDGDGDSVAANQLGWEE